MSSRYNLPHTGVMTSKEGPLKLELDPLTTMSAQQKAKHSSSEPDQTEPEAFQLEEATVEAFLEGFDLEDDLTEVSVGNPNSDQIALYFPEARTAAPNVEQYELGGMARPVFNIAFEGSDRAAEFYNAVSLLESLEQQGVQVPYQCREGYCGACRTQLVSGQVTYLQEPMAWINENEVLPCCCIPKSDIKLKLKG